MCVCVRSWWLKRKNNEQRREALVGWLLWKAPQPIRILGQPRSRNMRTRTLCLEKELGETSTNGILIPIMWCWTTWNRFLWTHHHHRPNMHIDYTTPYPVTFMQVTAWPCGLTYTHTHPTLLYYYYYGWIWCDTSSPLPRGVISLINKRTQNKNINASWFGCCTQELESHHNDDGVVPLLSHVFFILMDDANFILECNACQQTMDRIYYPDTCAT